MTAPSEPDQPTPVVQLVEDDDAVREATARSLRAAGFEVRSYRSGEEFLEASPSDPGCVVMDLRLPGSSGLELQTRLAVSENPLPIVFLTGHGAVRDSVQAMKSGAVDFLTKTQDGSALLDAVRRAIDRDGVARTHRSRNLELGARYARLTRREREVFAHLISGQLNKQVAYDLGISERTVKIHRRQVLDKLEAASIADLVRIASALGITPQGS
jgi:FixJ family two-component response regulator